MVAAESVQAKEPPLRPGRKNKADAAQDAAQAGLGPVQAALQRRNKNKQQQTGNEQQANLEQPGHDQQVNQQAVPEPQVALPTSEEVSQPEKQIAAQVEQAQPATANASANLPSPVTQQDMVIGDNVVIRADLSIAHDGVVQEQVQRFTGAPPIGRKPRGQQQQQQPIQPEQEAALAETFQPVPQSAEAEQYSSLTGDVPPGVVVHSGPVAKGKRKETQQSPVNPEDPNQSPTSYAIPDSTETVASYDYTLPPEVLPKPAGQRAYPEPQVYVPPAPDEQQKMYQMFDPPVAKTTEELIAEALSRAEDSAQLHQQHSAHHPALPEPAVQNYDVPDSTYVHPSTGAQPHAYVEEPYDLDTDYADPSQPGYHNQSQEPQYEQAEELHETGYPSPSVEEYNYTAPHDPAQWEQAEEEDFEHRPRCNGCGTYLEVGSQFCGECGYRLEARIPGCHLCGSPLEPSAKFCGECGSKRVESRPTPPMPERILDGNMVPERQSEEYEQYVAQSGQKPTQRSWVVKLLKMLES